ncbi:TPA: hypothetical protein MM329_000674 [Escherichia coli]|nr:hypothetical protein [Escherichia coli]HBZ8229040.1 hypothetical protein [Escherichia coli]HBZ8345768.1 hypothetical protein [Escherichia coli]HBZ8350837.1 hypothetical protein [Escherichia coli]HBZ8356169.1 hypothetical protein [Escherichia coli]
MGFDSGVIVAVLSLLGGLAVFIINLMKDKNKENLELEKRLSQNERSMEVLRTLYESVVKESEEKSSETREMKSSLKQIDSKSRELEIKVAILTNEKK